MNELESRIKHGGAIKRGNAYYCAVHTETPLSPKGVCVDCDETDRIMGAIHAEAEASRKSQEALEEDY